MNREIHKKREKIVFKICHFSRFLCLSRLNSVADQLPLHPMIWLYRLLFFPLLLLLLPKFLQRMFKRGGYAAMTKHRWGAMGILPKKRKGVLRIWIQAVSVGEVRAAETLIQAFPKQGYEFILTTTSSTGYQLALQLLGKTCLAVRGFPLDFWLFSQRAWRSFQPDAVILMEGEVWPEHCFQAQRRSCPIFLANARLSDRSFKRYQRCWKFILPVVKAWNSIHLILASSEVDKERFLKLGLSADKIIVCGNLKADAEVDAPLNEHEQLELQESLGFMTPPGGTRPCILLGASTWPGEESALLDLCLAARQKGLDCRLLLVPRHAERRSELEQWLKTTAQEAYWFRSWEGPCPQGTVVYVADTTGELRRLTQLGDLIFIGKSLPPHQGGQTPIEAAVLGKALLFGPNMSNFRAISDSLLSNQGAVRVKNTEELKEKGLALLLDPNRRSALGLAARRWHTSQQGSGTRMIEAIHACLHKDCSVSSGEG